MLLLCLVFTNWNQLVSICGEWKLRLVTTSAFPSMFCLQPFSMKNSASVPLKWHNGNKNTEVLCVLCRSTACKPIRACLKSVMSTFCSDLWADPGRSDGSQYSGLFWCLCPLISSLSSLFFCVCFKENYFPQFHPPLFAVLLTEAFCSHQLPMNLQVPCGAAPPIHSLFLLSSPPVAPGWLWLIFVSSCSQYYINSASLSLPPMIDGEVYLYISIEIKN